MQRVYSARDTFDATLLRDRLIDQGIEAVVQGEMLVGAIGELPPDSRPSVWIVDDSRYHEARTVIETWEQGEAEGSEWHCRQCGEHNAGSFAICWNCSRPHKGRHGGDSA